MTARQLRLIEPEPLADLGEIDCGPAQAPKALWAGYDVEGSTHPGRNHPALCRELVRRYSQRGDRVTDVFLGTGTVLVEAAKLGRQVQGWDISRRAAHLAVRNVAPHTDHHHIARWDAAAADPPTGTWSTHLILTSPEFPTNHHAGKSALQDHLRATKGIHAGQEWWEANTPGHICRRSKVDWVALGRVWRNCRRLLQPGGHLVVITRDYVRNGAIVPFTRQVADTLSAAGFEVLGLHWRPLRPSWFHATRLKKYPGAPIVDREDCIVATVAGDPTH